MAILKYRREIDGLRALAVIPVIFFHLGTPSFKGGYLGVDIFFVISGFLITSIILIEIKQSIFSITNFYERRIRRIAPVLSLVIISTIPFSWLLMLPGEFKEYLQSIFSSIFFFSNILFWNQSDYFDNPAEFKPLLHTWSLSIEEQFYILFPIFLIIASRYFKNKIFLILSGLSITSFLLAIYSSFNFQSANFYLLPTRAWEILFGSLLSYCMIYKEDVIKKYTKNNQAMLSFLGLILIIFSFFIFESSTPHPGVLTSMPVLGTGLIILSTPNNGFVSKILSTSLMVKIGLLSYSLYLWHVPIITLLKLYKLEELSLYDNLLAIFLTIILSLVTYTFVEKRFKNKKNFNQKKIFTYYLSSLVLLTSLSLFLYATDIFSNNLENKLEEDSIYFYNIAKKDTNTNTLETRLDDGECKFFSLTLNQEFVNRFNECSQSLDTKALFLIGDSHAMNLHNIIFLSTDSKFFVTIANGGARPKFKDGEYTFKDITKFINSNAKSIDTVYYHQSGSYLIFDYKMRVDSAEIFDKNKNYKINNDDILIKLNYLDSLSPKVVWVGPFLESRQDFMRQIIKGKKNFKISNYNKEVFDKLDNTIHKMNTFINIDYVPFDSIYKITNKHVFYEGCLFFRDQDHLSNCAEEIIGSYSDYFITTD